MKTILIIDDDDDYRESLRESIENENYAVVDEINGLRGLQACAHYKPDLVICDVFMPEQDGIEFLLKVKVRQPLTKVIMISGGGRLNSPEVYLQMATMMKADGVLKKPFSIDDLLTLMDNTLATN